MFFHKKNELFLYICAWQCELGRYEFRGSKYIGLNIALPCILNSMYSVFGGHQMNSRP